MDRHRAAERLRLAELELRATQLQHDGSMRATERYRAAVSELAIAEAVAATYLIETTPH